jgi:hypothetical protein
MGGRMSETPQQAARRLSASAIKGGFKPEALHEYKDASGKVLYWRIRLKHANGDKRIWPMHLNGHGYDLKEPEFTGLKPLYRLPELLADPDAVVWFVEGEWSADHLTKMGVLATTSGGSTSAKHADFAPLAKRTANVWPDNDAGGLKHAQEVAEKLIAVGASVQLVDIAKLNLPPKGDVVDWLKEHPNATALDLDKLPLVAYAKANSEIVEVEAEAPRKSQATRLIEFAKNAELFHAEDGRGFATYQVGTHQETWPIHKCAAFKDWIKNQYYQEAQHGASSAAWQDAYATIDALARYDKGSQTRPVHMRMANYDGRIYIDMCDPEWRAIEITAEGWSVVSQPPVRFIRNRGMKALPVPVHGELATLFNYLNVVPSERCLVQAWLIAALRPTGPYPILILQGKQGTCKSTAARVLRSLVDPSRAPLRSAPRKEQDLMIAANNSWFIALDNLSGLSTWLSDSLCQIATGAGFSTRELWSDTDEILIDAQRPIILNGIDDLAARQDLIDRSITINLQPIREDKRKPESEFWPEFNKDKPAILGALLDRVSVALRESPNLRPPHLSRMADFEVWASASLPLDEREAFVEAFKLNRKYLVELGLEGSPVGEALRVWLDEAKHIESTSTDLLTSSNSRVSELTGMSRAWPKSPRGLSGEIHRLAPALRSVGVVVKFAREPGSGRRILDIRKSPSQPSQPHTNTSKNNGLSCDTSCDTKSTCDTSCDTSVTQGDSTKSLNKKDNDAGDGCDDKIRIVCKENNGHKPNGDQPPGEIEDEI